MNAKLILLFALFTFSFSLFAEQCQFITQSRALRAVELLAKSRELERSVLTLCMYCEEKTLSRREFNDIAIGRSGVPEIPADIKIDGEIVDLGFVYVKIDQSRWGNLGYLVGCAITGKQAYIED